MRDFLTHLLDTTGFPPRWECGNWTPAHGWLHIASDLAVWSAYFAIPCILAYFVLRRRDVPFPTIFWLFGAFILACGTTHLMEAIIFWHPVYRLAGLIKLTTAVVSWGTVIALVPTVPKALSLRSPEDLEREIAARQAALVKSEAVLREKEAELELVTSRTPLLLTRCRSDGRYVYVNRAAAEFLGRPAEEIVGRPIAEVLGADAFATIAPYVERVLRGEVVEFETEITYACAGRRFMRVEYTPDRDERGDVIGWVGTISDNTERKQREREREEHAAELAAALAKRSEDANRAEEAERRLREADRRKNEFLATLSHELRNPLAPIRNALELLRRADGDAAVIAEAQNVMGRQLDQIVRLVDDLLDVSRITQGKVRVRKERVDLAAVLRSAVEAARPLVEKQALELTVSLPPEPVYLDADATRLSQVIANLLHNATKYTEKGGHVWLTAERQGGEAVITVRDTGIGIAAEHLPHLFEMFSQVTPALERSQGGLGIGLSLVRGLVELHGGTSEARSAGSGKGSEFIIRLPLSGESLPYAVAKAAAADKAAGGRKHRILVVDDNRDSADSLAKMLRMTGHETLTAYDGLEAVQTAAAYRPEVVLLDIGLPKMNGYEAARHIREQPWGRGMALIALTGWGQEEDKRRALDAGFDHHFTKPVEPAALERLLAFIEPASGS